MWSPFTGYGAGFDDDDPSTNIITIASATAIAIDSTMVGGNCFDSKVFAFWQPVQASRNITYGMFGLKLICATYSPLSLAVLNDVSRLSGATYTTTIPFILNDMVISVRKSTFTYGATRLAILNDIEELMEVTYCLMNLLVFNDMIIWKYIYGATIYPVLNKTLTLQLIDNVTLQIFTYAPIVVQEVFSYAPCFQHIYRTNDISTAVINERAWFRITNNDSFLSIRNSISSLQNSRMTARVRKESIEVISSIYISIFMAVISMAKLANVSVSLICSWVINSSVCRIWYSLYGRKQKHIRSMFAFSRNHYVLLCIFSFAIIYLINQHFEIIQHCFESYTTKACLIRIKQQYWLPSTKPIVHNNQFVDVFDLHEVDHEEFTFIGGSVFNINKQSMTNKFDTLFNGRFTERDKE